MYHIIVNPASRSGRGKKYWERILPVLTERNVPYHVHFTEYHRHATEIVKALTTHIECTPEILHLIVLGGDGTVNEVLQGISRFDKVALSYIPTGSSNDLARDIGISTDPVKALLHLLDDSDILTLDMGIVHYLDKNSDTPVSGERRFLVSCGIGYDAAICQQALRSKVKNILNKCGLGKLTYLMIALIQLIAVKRTNGQMILYKNCDFENSVLGQTVLLTQFLFLAGMNHKYEGGGFKFAPDADTCDGILNLCCVSGIKKHKVFQALPAGFKGEHFRFDGVDPYAAPSYRIQLDEPCWVHTDGEVDCKSSSIFVECKTKVIRFIY